MIASIEIQNVENVFRFNAMQCDLYRKKRKIYGFILIKLKSNFFFSLVHSFFRSRCVFAAFHVPFSYYLPIYNCNGIELLCMLLDFLCNQRTCAHHKSFKMDAMNVKIKKMNENRRRKQKLSSLNWILSLSFSFYSAFRINLNLYIFCWNIFASQT